MKNRKRAFAAIIRDNHILMVRVVNGIKEFWTLPGGGLEDGETYEDAVVREVLEEVNLKVTVVKHLFTDTFENGTQKCFLVEEAEQNSIPKLGFDPELPKDKQQLKEVKWQPIKEMSKDIQVSKIIKEMGFKIE